MSFKSVLFSSLFCSVLFSLLPTKILIAIGKSNQTKNSLLDERRAPISNPQNQWSDSLEYTSRFFSPEVVRN